MGLFDVGQVFKPRHVAGVKNSRFIEPHDWEEINDFRVKYDNASKLASDIGDLPTGFRAFVILDGKFVFGDFLEALIVKHDWICDLTISTLSMSQDNIDSLSNLINGGFVRNLDMVVSHHWWSSERRGILPYLYDQLDIDDHLQLAVASVHTKIAMIRTKCGKKITIHGSANLRSSSNIEQIVVEHSPDLYDFCHGIHAAIIEKHKTINKAVRRTDLWSSVIAGSESSPLPGIRSAAHCAGV